MVSTVLTYDVPSCTSTVCTVYTVQVQYSMYSIYSTSTVCTVYTVQVQYSMYSICSTSASTVQCMYVQPYKFVQCLDTQVLNEKAMQL